MWARIFCWSNISKGETPKARRKTARKYRYSYRMGPALVAGQFVRAASLFGAAFFSPAPRPRAGMTSGH